MSQFKYIRGYDNDIEKIKEEIISYHLGCGEIVCYVREDNECLYFMVGMNDDLIQLQGSGYGVKCPHCGEVFIV